MSILEPRGARPARSRAEAGQSSSEDVGIIVVAAMLVVSLVVPATAWGADLSAGVSQAICRIVGEDCSAVDDGATEAAPQPQDYRPPQCTVRRTNEGYSASISLGFVKIGEDQYFVATETRERQPDGTTKPKITVVVTDGASLGVEGGLGPSAEFGDSGIGAEVEGSVGINAKYGDTWEFDSAADYEAFRQQWSDYEIQEQQMQGEGALGVALYKSLTDSWVEPPPPAAYSSNSFGIDASGTGTLGAYVFDDKKSGGTEDSPLSLNLDGYAKVDLGGSYLTTTDNRPGHEGEKSTTYTFTGDGSAGADAVVVGGDILDGTSQGAIKVSEKTLPDGTTQITGLTLTTTAGGDLGLDPKATTGPTGGGNKGSVGSNDKAQDTVVTTTTLEVTDANRPVVEAWLAAGGPTGKSAQLALPTTIFEPTATGAGNDPFSDLLYREAVVTKESFHTDDENFNLGLGLAFGMKVGFDAGLTDEETRPTGASYLDAPGPDGTRSYVDNTACAS